MIPELVSRNIGRNILLAQKASPGVLFGAGIVGMVGSTILACRATLKMQDLMFESSNNLDIARALNHPEYSEMDRKKDITLIRFQTTVKIVKLYGPSVVLGGLSIAALTSSHNILTRRNAALTAAYAALEKGFNEYRARVVDKYGEDEDRDLRYGTEEVEIANGKGKKKLVSRVAPGAPSIYARFFDQGSASWSKEPEYNLIFLKAQQNWANDLLHSRGHVFLNEVYDSVGVPRSKAGAVVGWLLSPNGDTDNFINFGVFDYKSEKARDFVNGHEGAILLDFNVDGVIYDKIDQLGEELSWQLAH